MTSQGHTIVKTILTQNANSFHFKKHHTFLDNPVQALQYQPVTIASTDVFLFGTYREPGKKRGVLFGENFMRRDYSVGERGTVGQGQAGERGTVGQGQADVIRQKPVPVTLSLSLSTPQIRRTQTSALQGGRRGS